MDEEIFFMYKTMEEEKTKSYIVKQISRKLRGTERGNWKR